MIYVKMQDGRAVAVSNEYPGNEAMSIRGAYENRNDWDSFERAQEVAAQLGSDYIATDAGTGVYPRFDVIEAPKVGHQISYAFNGDYYPDGEIVKIGKDMKIVYSSTGSKYYRRGQTGRWVKTGGTWTMVRGHRTEYNREF